MAFEITIGAVRDVIISKHQEKPFDAYDILSGLSNLSAEWVIEERYRHTHQLDKIFKLLTDLVIRCEINRQDYCNRAITFRVIQPDWSEIQDSYIHMVSAIAHQLVHEKENLDPLLLVYEAAL